MEEAPWRKRSRSEDRNKPQVTDKKEADGPAWKQGLQLLKKSQPKAEESAKPVPAWKSGAEMLRKPSPNRRTSLIDTVPPLADVPWKSGVQLLKKTSRENSPARAGQESAPAEADVPWKVGVQMLKKTSRETSPARMSNLPEASAQGVPWKSVKLRKTGSRESSPEKQTSSAQLLDVVEWKGGVEMLRKRSPTPVRREPEIQKKESAKSFLVGKLNTVMREPEEKELVRQIPSQDAIPDGSVEIHLKPTGIREKSVERKPEIALKPVPKKLEQPTESEARIELKKVPKKTKDTPQPIPKVELKPIPAAKPEPTQLKKPTTDVPAKSEIYLKPKERPDEPKESVGAPTILEQKAKVPEPKQVTVDDVVTRVQLKQTPQKPESIKVELKRTPAMKKEVTKEQLPEVQLKPVVVRAAVSSPAGPEQEQVVSPSVLHPKPQLKSAMESMPIEPEPEKASVPPWRKKREPVPVQVETSVETIQTPVPKQATAKKEPEEKSIPEVLITQKIKPEEPQLEVEKVPVPKAKETEEQSVSLKPIPRRKEPEEEKVPEIVLKKTPQKTKPDEPEPEGIYLKKIPAPKPKDAEDQNVSLKPIPRRKEPEEENLPEIVLKRTPQKTKPVEDEPEGVQLRKIPAPKLKEAEEQTVTLKPIPRRKEPEEEKVPEVVLKKTPQKTKPDEPEPEGIHLKKIPAPKPKDTEDQNVSLKPIPRRKEPEDEKPAKVVLKPIPAKPKPEEPEPTGIELRKVPEKTREKPEIPLKPVPVVKRDDAGSIRLDEIPQETKEIVVQLAKPTDDVPQQLAKVDQVTLPEPIPELPEAKREVPWRKKAIPSVVPQVPSEIVPVTLAQPTIPTPDKVEEHPALNIPPAIPEAPKEPVTLKPVPPARPAEPEPVPQVVLKRTPQKSKPEEVEAAGIDLKKVPPKSPEAPKTPGTLATIPKTTKEPEETPIPQQVVLKRTPQKPRAEEPEPEVVKLKKILHQTPESVPEKSNVPVVKTELKFTSDRQEVTQMKIELIPESDVSPSWRKPRTPVPAPEPVEEKIQPEPVLVPDLPDQETSSVTTKLKRTQRKHIPQVLEPELASIPAVLDEPLISTTTVQLKPQEKVPVVIESTKSQMEMTESRTMTDQSVSITTTKSVQQKSQVEVIAKHPESSEEKTKRPKMLKASLVVGPKCQPPVFTKKLQPLSSRPGKKVRLHCQFQGEPEPTITWYRNESVLLPTSDRLDITTEPGSSVLEVSQLVLDDTGIYTCRAVNEAGSAITTANFIVQGKFIFF